MDRPTTTLLLSSLRHSVEGRFTSGLPHLDDTDAWKSAVLKVEALRVDYNARRFLRMGQREEARLTAALRHGLLDLLNDREFASYIKGLRFRVAVGPRTRERLPPEFLERDVDIETGIMMLVDRLSGLEPATDAGQPELALGQLKRIVPDQKIAPAKFDIIAGRLVLIDQPAKIDPEDVATVKNARDLLLAQSEKIIAELGRSNCDRRIMQSVEEIKSGLQSNNNIVELGLLNISCRSVCELARDELPGPVQGMVDGFTTALAMFVAQFPEWQKFTEKAANVNLDSTDISGIARSAVEIAQQVELRPDLADPEVPKTIRILATLVRDPANTAKRAAFAALRTIENLVARIFTYGIELIDQTANKTIGSLATAASRLIVVGLMSLAIASVASLGPVASKIAETSWMRTAVEIAKKQIEGAE